MKTLPAPGSCDRAEELLAVRAMLTRLGTLAIQAAEARYPGIEAHVTELIRREETLEWGEGQA